MSVTAVFDGSIQIVFSLVYFEYMIKSDDLLTAHLSFVNSKALQMFAFCKQYSEQVSKVLEFN
jgi:hypothetical protein